MAQITTEVQKYDMANTLASTAENQKESVKVNVIAPTKPAARIVHMFSCVISSPGLISIFLAIIVMIQNRNRITKALLSTETILIITAALLVSPNAKSERKRAISWKVGAPGGCPI